MAARDDNFGLDDGTVDPFTGLAPALTPEQQQDELAARQVRLRASGQRTANTNTGYNEQRSAETAQNTAGKSVAELERRAAQGDPLVTPEVLASARKMEKLNRESMNSAGYKALTYGILAAPAAVTGAGAAIGGAAGLGFGAGEGTLAATAEPIVQVANEAGLIAPSAPALATATGEVGAPFAMASPFAATGGGGAAAAGGGATLPGMIGADLAQYGPGVAMAAGPAIINKLTSGKTKEEKALLEKQQQLAQEAKIRQGQQQDARMNQLGQQLLAFNPSNQLLAKMYGPDAAFSPEQMATMVQGQAPQFDPAVGGYTGTDPKKLAAQQEVVRRAKEYEEAEAKRREMIMNNWQAPGPGPAPIQMAAPQAARRY